ncbi:NAD(P)H-hydrate dehydratase [Motilimonas sp. E26]|uniref:NAD(P)H-hydrate dehydratase n=1 Tax=Motilimonas sp. E26 TaxID=2865674 RepID=UPI001E3EA178|nr:NAD(P)H-hydrate dehydratase [Motilimonas sp. E26]
MKNDTVLSALQVKQAEQAWANQRGGETWPLMVCASESFVRHFFPSIYQQGKHSPLPKITIVVGCGNNGGDGYYIGKLLLDAGVNVSLIAPFGAPKAGIDAERAAQCFRDAGGRVLSELPETLDDNSEHVAIDALFGSGLSSTLSSQCIHWVQQINSQFATIYSVDVPSGLDADTGQAMPVAVNASATRSFIAWKPGLLTGDGPAYCGQLTLDNLGITSTGDWKRNSAVVLPNRFGNTYKSKYGEVSVVGGHQNMAGAALIATQAALNAGAGRVYIHCDPRYFAASVSHRPEIMLLDHIDLHDSQSVWVIGPGLGRDLNATQVLKPFVYPDHHSTTWRGVLDADALRYIAKVANFNATNWVLTPHEGEAADLLDWSIDCVQQDRAAAALALSLKYQTVVVLKGAGTLVCKGKKLIFCHVGSPAMATAGMGDCLAGIIGALMAQGLSAFDAAVAGVNWHASLGFALAKTQRVVLASDIVAKLKNKV